MNSRHTLLRVLIIAVMCTHFGVEAAAQARVDRFNRALYDQNGPVWYRLNDQGWLMRDATGAFRKAPPAEIGDTATPASHPPERSRAFTLGSWTNHHPGSWPEAVAIGDVTADGRPDVVVTTTSYFDPANDYHVFVYPQLPTGVLGLPSKYPYGAEGSQNGIVLVDLDENQVVDVVVSHSAGISVLLADGLGGLLAATVFGAEAAGSLSAMDVNLDQHIDILALHGDGSVTVFLGDGNGGFDGVQAVTAGGPTASDHELGDLDNDGFTDLAVASSGAILTVSHHDQTSSFLPFPDSYPMGGSEVCWGLGVGDVTGDGLEDAVLGRPLNSPTHLWVMTQDGAGGLTGPAIVPTYDIPEPIAVTDVDLDGLEDVVVLHGGWVRAGVYLQGAAGLEPEQLYSIPYASHYAKQGLALGDFSSDFCTDLAIADYNQGLVVLHGSGCLRVFADGFESGDTSAWSGADGPAF